MKNVEETWTCGQLKVLANFIHTSVGESIRQFRNNSCADDIISLSLVLSIICPDGL